MGCMATSADRSILELARRQRGLVTISQLRDAGLSPRQVLTRRTSGLLHPLHRGVYLVGGGEPDHTTVVLAAVLAAGPGAIASHASAAALWDLPVPAGELPEVTVPLGRQPRPPGVTVHRSRLLEARDRRTVEGIPVTSVPRLLCDLARRCTDDELSRLLDEAWRRRLTTPNGLDARSARLPMAPGRSPARVARVVGERRKTRRAQESELERRIWRLIRESDLPLPVAQHVVDLPSGRRRLDLAWPRQWLAYECDGYEWHKGRHRFDDDRVRRNELVAAGWTVLNATDAMTDQEILAPLTTRLCR
jgi:very-short-patch-repair endonuclease